MEPDKARSIIEAASPTWAESEAARREAQTCADEFTQLPPAQRAAAARAPYGTGGAYDPVERAFRGADDLRFYRATRTETEDAFERGEREHGASSYEVTNLAKSRKDRVRALQRAGLAPRVLHRDDDEESWDPTHEELQLRMIPRAEFEAWPALTYTPRPRHEHRRPPVGEIDHPSRSSQLQKVLSAFPAMRAFRDELQGRGPADPTSEALECLSTEIAGAARWGRTVEISTAQAPLWAEYRRRIEERDGPLKIITGTTA
jgi:hypothetical protein